MKDRIDKILVYALVGFLAFIFFVQLVNLIGFGGQEIYLNHPEYPEGEVYMKDLELGKRILTVTTLITGVLLTFTVVSRKRRNYILFNWISLVSFIFIGVLSIIAFYNGKMITGALISAFVIVGALHSIFKINRTTLSPTKPKPGYFSQVL